MNSEEFEGWKECVMLHSKSLKNLIDERAKIKEVFEEHLHQFFEWDEIKYDKDFNKISLFYKSETGAVMFSENLSNLGMDFIVNPDFNEGSFEIIRIDLYPFGLPEEGEYIED